MTTDIFRIAKTSLPRIVMPGHADTPLLFAAEELARYLHMILGLPATVPPTPRTPEIHLIADSESGFTEDEFEIVSRRGDLHVRGAAGRAVLFGVYELLRRFGGCCFSGPSPFGEYVPRRAAVEIGPLPLRVKPRFQHRALQLYSKTDSALVRARIDWMAKNGFNYVAYNVFDDKIAALCTDGTLDPATQEQREQEESRFSETLFNADFLPELQKRGIQLHSFAHNLLNFLPPGKYFAEHPEWYMLKDGKRQPHGAQLCLCTSNPAMVEEFSRNMVDYLKAHPEVAFVSVGPQDGEGGGCECDACRAMDDHPDDVFKPGKHFRSPEGENQGKIRRYARFINAVAQVVHRQYPHRRLSYQGYVDLNFPPRDIRLEDNIVIHYSLYWRCGAHSFDRQVCPANRFMGATMERWLREYPGRVFVGDNAFEGMGSQLGLPYPIDEVIFENWTMFYKLGVSGMMAQFNDTHYIAHALNYFAFGRMCWDDRANTGSVLDEFLLGMFGGAGGALRPIYESFHQTIREIRANGKAYSVFLQEQPKWKRLYPEKLDACLEPTAANVACFLEKLGADRLDACLSKARALADDEREREQVRAFTDLAGYWRRAASFYGHFWPTEVTPEMAPADLRAARKLSCAACHEVIDYLRNVEPRCKGWIAGGLYRRWECLLRRIETQRDDRLLNMKQVRISPRE